MNNVISQCLKIGAFALSLCASASAQEEEKGPFSGLVAAGYTASSGNTDTTAFNFNAEGNYDQGKWHHTLFGNAISSSDARSCGHMTFRNPRSLMSRCLWT